MQPFVLNRHGRLVFPSVVFPDLDFSVIRSQDQLDQVVRRDFETKAPTGIEMLRRIEIDAYADRHQLMRDMALSVSNWRSSSSGRPRGRLPRRPARTAPPTPDAPGRRVISG